MRHLELNFSRIWCAVGAKINFFSVKVSPTYPAPCAVTNPVFVGVCFWALFIPGAKFSLLTPILCCLNCYSFIIGVDSWQCKSYSFVFIFQDCLICSYPFVFPSKFLESTCQHQHSSRILLGWGADGDHYSYRLTGGKLTYLQYLTFQTLNVVNSSVY